MRLTSQAQQDLGWWSRNITLASHFLHTHPVGLTLFSDATLEGWGGTDGTSHVGGRWTDDESPVHINVLELHAAKLTLLAFAPNVSRSHIRLMLDNTTAAAYIEKMGGACTPTLAMRLLCLYGIGQRTETFGCLLPSSRTLRTPWQIFIPGIFGTILNGCLTLWCSNSFLPSPLFQRLTSLQAD